MNNFTIKELNKIIFQQATRSFNRKLNFIERIKEMDNKIFPLNFLELNKDGKKQITFNTKKDAIDYFINNKE